MALYYLKKNETTLKCLNKALEINPNSEYAERAKEEICLLNHDFSS